MSLSYYNISVSQTVLGENLRPYQNPIGNNDDKSVTMDELARKAKDYQLIPYHRPNGSIDLVKKMIFLNIPIITRTLLEEKNDIGHYRLIKGYDDQTRELIQDDSLQGHNLRYSYDLFTLLWKKFNYEYLILVPLDKDPLVRAILHDDTDESSSWKKAVTRTEQELSKNPNDIFNTFNLSVALYHTGDYQKSASTFETVENQLPFRMLWYQIEPILTYVALGNNQKVLSMTDAIFENQNRAFSELYIIRGELYKKQGDLVSAKKEFEKAVYYNKNLFAAQEALKSVE
jgi:tetratricopeptide (TPR) repeat protein